jgi:hypothetical protein
VQKHTLTLDELKICIDSIDQRHERRWQAVNFALVIEYFADSVDDA